MEILWSCQLIQITLLNLLKMIKNLKHSRRPHLSMDYNGLRSYYFSKLLTSTVIGIPGTCPNYHTILPHFILNERNHKLSTFALYFFLNLSHGRFLLIYFSILIPHSFFFFGTCLLTTQPSDHKECLV